MLQCGIIGCGRICPNHFVAVHEHPDVNIRWLCDIDIANTAPFAEKAPHAQCTALATDLLEDPSVDFVHILTDHAAHYPIAMMALIAGKHVIVEKPFTLNTDEAQLLVNTAAGKGLQLICISQHRFDPLINHIRQLIESGALGELLLINGRLLCGRGEEYYQESYWHGRKDLDGGSALINQGYHIFDIILSIGGLPKSIHAYAARRKHTELIETEDTISVQYVLNSGAMGSLNITSGLVPEEWDAKIEVVGTRGRICFDLESPHQLPEIAVPGVREDEFLAYIERSSHPAGIGYYGDLHTLQIKDFVRALLDQDEPSFQPQSAVNTLTAIQQAYASAQQNGFQWGNRK